MSRSQFIYLSLFFLALASCSTVQNSRKLASVESDELVCKNKNSHIFKTENTHKAFKISLITDQDALQKQDESESDDEPTPIHPGLIKFQNKKQDFLLPILISQRGNSRRYSCTFKPLKIEFMNSGVEQISRPKSLSPDQESYQKLYYQNFRNLYLKNKERVGIAVFSAEKTKHEPFKGLGKSMKIVSHCGRAKLSVIDEKSLEEQEDALLKEYYLYKIQKILYPLSLDSQLVEIDYTNPDGSTLLTAYGFFRERAQRTAKRCRMTRIKGKPNGDYTTDRDSSYSTRFLMLLLQTYDFGYNDHLDASPDSYFEAHNIELLVSEDNTIHPVPYDFDLSLLVRNRFDFGIYRSASPEVVAQARADFEERVKPLATLEKRVHYLQKWINEDHLDKFKWNSNDGNTKQEWRERGSKNIKNFLSKKSQIRSLIINSKLNKESQGDFLQWLDLSTKELKKTLEKIED